MCTRCKHTYSSAYTRLWGRWCAPCAWPHSSAGAHQSHRECPHVPAARLWSRSRLAQMYTAQPARPPDAVLPVHGAVNARNCSGAARCCASAVMGRLRSVAAVEDIEGCHGACAPVAPGQCGPSAGLGQERMWRSDPATPAVASSCTEPRMGHRQTSHRIPTRPAASAYVAWTTWDEVQ
jgi:hypothetical protein